MTDRLVLIPERVVDPVGDVEPQIGAYLTRDAQQRIAEEAWQRFDAAYCAAYASNHLRNGDETDRQQAHDEAFREAFEAMLGPVAAANGRGPDRDNNRPVTEEELLNGYGAQVDELVRSRPVPHALRRDLGGAA